MRTCVCKTDEVVELGGQGPLAMSPRFRVSPSPSWPSSFAPQHLIVASSCGKGTAGITDHFTTGSLGESCTEGFQAL